MSQIPAETCTLAALSGLHSATDGEPCVHLAGSFQPPNATCQTNRTSNCRKGHVFMPSESPVKFLTKLSTQTHGRGPRSPSQGSVHSTPDVTHLRGAVVISPGNWLPFSGSEMGAIIFSISWGYQSQKMQLFSFPTTSGIQLNVGIQRDSKRQPWPNPLRKHLKKGSLFGYGLRLPLDSLVDMFYVSTWNGRKDLSVSGVN